MIASLTEGLVQDSDQTIDLFEGVVVHQADSHYAILRVESHRFTKSVSVHMTIADGDPRTVDTLGDLTRGFRRVHKTDRADAISVSLECRESIRLGQQESCIGIS